MSRLDLQKLTLLLALLAGLLTFGNSFFAAYTSQREQLFEQTLEANRAYARKLADTTDQFFLNSRRELAYAADVLSTRFDDPAARDGETERLKLKSDQFSRAIIVRADGEIVSASPGSAALLGVKVNSVGATRALTERKPLISDPYIATDGTYLVAVTQPIFAPDGAYLGFLSASLFLRERNALHGLLGVHYYRDGSYLYVVDTQGNLIFHEDGQRVGQNVSSNQVVQQVLQRHEGSQRVINTRGVDMLAGYAPIQSTGWGIVSQRPTAAITAKLQQLAHTTLLNAVPFTVISLAVFWWLSKLISTPIRALADTAEHWGAPEAASRISTVNSWYFEVSRLKVAMLAGVSLLQQKMGALEAASMTDPLTGLRNRRGLELALRQFELLDQRYAALALDIDHFKHVNDQYGHDVGDEVLRFLAAEMKECSRPTDVLCRMGGEEFLMLLPETDAIGASIAAERLLARLRQTPSPTGAPVTASIGIASSGNYATPDATFKAADNALYQAKRSGRDRVVLAST
ncbi:sensor domain-containing diguanylate cyclase [Pseudomonas stutzeri]|uniref:diguanylate cyclase n=1 Tax=Stutzerimonas stutzeri TaxID=316 RepID=A0A2N8S3C3_STUST|nr:sensor domain-containing diguanylate cyclase [Stutzerimonas stutzeri]MCQ4296462.1 sensor domain-containing diguanylate cyclase [Stutzerimonas stutzeri]PNF81112.1 GGDEF domain-containing protein [Stutzerimonas stutzeri]